MRPPPPSGPPIWLRAALWFTTARLHGGRPALPAGTGEGWTLRAAAPKWACIWRNHPQAQRRLRVIVMPRPWDGVADTAWQALLQHRLHELGLAEHGPDSRLLAQAEHDLMARLAPPWTRMMARPHR
ncbi:hypothetical protein [Celeribacter indicus]|uniref:Uncharacterized protein n=1 Tax=Celeribacter indicus TaxID=1208324 RepID=A0A0B5DS37_9RHOB|nr:hypothetical protein [Celeribacter indicus]AJE45854.1 hypothetical protein P73_1139 [Celeribacter indicus]SDW62319.1 hypothetical protein SAMN05443573_10584 [Celeribacter indicus]